MGLFDKHKEKKQKEAQKAAVEQDRHQKLIAGELVPIITSTDLQSGETAYLELTARRMATVDSTVQETVTTGKKKHVVRRAVVGGVLGGGVGAIVGGATAGNNQKSITTEKTVYNTELIDSGDLIFTNKRIVFTGNDGVTSIPYKTISAMSYSGNQLKVSYPDMLNEEYYEVFGSATQDIQLYYDRLKKG